MKFEFDYVKCKRLNIENVGENVELHSSHTLSGETVNWYNHFGKQVGNLFLFIDFFETGRKGEREKDGFGQFLHVP